MGAVRGLSYVLAAIVCSAPIATPAVAQTTSAQTTAPAAKAPAKPAEQDIIVTARKPVDKQQALKFTRAASAPVDGQLARFNSDVCPVAIGFPAAVAERIVERMRDVADAARVPVAKAGCKGNMVLIAAQDGSDMVRQMEKLQTHLIVGLGPRELRALIASHDPVHSWTIASVQNAFGDEPRSPGGGGSPTLEVYTASHINPPTQQAIQMSVVIIDWPAMMGKSTIQIADYAAMRTLAKTRPLSGGGAVDSILALFDTKATPLAELSEADLAYMHSLYALPGTRYDYFQIGQISNGVKKAAQIAP